MGSVRLAGALLLVSVLTFPFWAKLAAQPTAPSGSLAGQILDADGAALAGAELELQFNGPGATTYAAQSGDEGRFRFERLSPGRYTLHIQRNGYLTQTYQDPETAETDIRVGPAGDSPKINVRMVRQAIISGQVLDADGQPVPGALVSALQWKDAPDGTRTLTPKARDISTGTDGQFSIGGMAAGNYYLLAEDPALWTGLRQPVRVPGDPVPQQHDLPTFYPRADNPGDATPIELASGAYRRGVEIRLRGGPVFRVAGTILDPTTGSPPNQTTMTWYPLMGGFIDFHHYQMAKQVDEHGQFQMPALPSGEYLVLVTANAVSTEHEVTIADRDLTGLVLSADPGFNLTGKVVVLGEGRQARLPATVALHRVGSPLIGIASARVDANGRFVMKGVTTGAYDLIAETRGGEPLYVERIQVDGKKSWRTHGSRSPGRSTSKSHCHPFRRGTDFQQSQASCRQTDPLPLTTT